ncbi:DUF1638 domain-containing protein [Eubacteriaceae bacterium ES2]|nr:DUF1638 domain-containing protein [Eubacteriaceae bacterium ES2]
MHLKLIGCKVIQREIASVVYKCPNVIDVTMIRQDYHQNPDILRSILQDEIVKIDNAVCRHTNGIRVNEISAILLGYGLCSYATAGLKSQKYPIIIPRAHDCITLLMGSKEDYKEDYSRYVGTFFYSQGFLELGLVSDDLRFEKLRAEYQKKYKDPKRVERLLQIEEEMLKNYKYAALIDWPELTAPFCESKVKEISKKKGWAYRQINGNNSLLEDLVNGNWSEDRFLTLPPGQEMAPSFDDEIMKIF